MECRWRDQLSSISDFDGLAGKISRSGRQTMGLFLSVTGWSTKVVSLLKQKPDKVIIMMEGYEPSHSIIRVKPIYESLS